jgi:hypothetical protein
MADNASLGLDLYLSHAKGQSRISKDKLIKMLECGIELFNALGDNHFPEYRELEYFFQQLILNVKNEKFEFGIENEIIAIGEHILEDVGMPLMIHAMEGLKTSFLIDESYPTNSGGEKIDSTRS